MKTHLVSLVAFGALVAVTLGASFQPDGEKDKGPKKGPPEGKKGFVLGKLLPPQVRERLDLTEAQSDKLDALEKEVKAKLEKILTPDQQRIAQEPPEKKGDKGPPDGKGKKGDKGDKGDKGKKDKGPPDGKKDDKGCDREEARLTPASDAARQFAWQPNRHEMMLAMREFATRS